MFVPDVAKQHEFVLVNTRERPETRRAQNLIPRVCNQTLDTCMVHSLVEYIRARDTQFTHLASLPIVSLKATFGLPEITGQLYSVRIL